MKCFLMSIFVLFLFTGDYRYADIKAEEKKPDLNLNWCTSFVVFPQDCNANYPMAFGGKLLSEMDRCAGITTRRFLYASSTAKDAVTVSINNIQFHKTAEVKDLLIVTGQVIKTGKKSITIKVSIEKEIKDGEKIVKELVIDGEFIFCSYDLVQKKAIEHGIQYP